MTKTTGNKKTEKTAKPTTEKKPATKTSARKNAAEAAPAGSVDAGKKTTVKATLKAAAKRIQSVLTRHRDDADKQSPTIPTEAEILAWNGPEEDYMNPSHLAYFRKKLLDWQEELIRNADETTGGMRTQEATSDPADRATQEEEHALELRTRDRERKLLNKIRDSLRQIDEGTYGFCAETGEPIGLKRLNIRPTTSLSVEAQERHEARKKLQGN